MKIKQVEELVGITKKNIRFYEEEGLLKVDRAENGYREYQLKDVEQLKKIKLLRKLGVPIEEIREVLEEKISLLFCLEKQIRRIERDKENLSKMEKFCEKAISEQMTLHRLNVDECLEEIEKIEKGGVQFMNVEQRDVHQKRKKGAIIGAIVADLIMMITIIVLLWANSIEPIPIGLMLLFVGFPIIVIICTTVALIGRLKEIEGGEEDEASKY